MMYQEKMLLRTLGILLTLLAVAFLVGQCGGQSAMAQTIVLPSAGAESSGDCLLTVATIKGWQRGIWGPCAWKEQAKESIVVVPVATTKNGYTTGITIVNLSDTDDLLVGYVEFIDATDTTTAHDVGFGYQTRIPARRRWTRMLSEVLQGEVDGSLRIHIISTQRAKYQAYSALIDPGGITTMMYMPEWTTRILNN